MLLVTARSCCHRVLQHIRYEVPMHTNSTLTAKQLFNNCKQRTIQWTKPQNHYRQYHCNTQNGPQATHGRFWPCRSHFAKHRNEGQSGARCFRRSLFLLGRTVRVYCTRTGSVTVTNASKKIAVPKVSEIGRLLSLAVPEKKPLFCKFQKSNL